MACIVVEHGTSGVNRVQVLKWKSDALLFGELGLGARVGDGPGGEGFDKIGRVRVVDHSHRAKRAIESSNQILDFPSTCWNFAQIKNLGDVCIGLSLRSQAVKKIETLLD